VIGQTSAGVLRLNVMLKPSGFSGMLEIDCDLPGAAFHPVEGARLSVATFKFVQVPDQGFTLFHIQQD